MTVRIKHSQRGQINMSQPRVQRERCHLV